MRRTVRGRQTESNTRWLISGGMCRQVYCELALHSPTRIDPPINMYVFKGRWNLCHFFNGRHEMLSAQRSIVGQKLAKSK